MEEKRNLWKWICFQVRRTKHPRLALERFLAGHSFHQVLAALVLFGVVFVSVGLYFYSGNWGKAFADMASPVTLRGEAYNTMGVVAATDGAPAVTVQNPDTLPLGKLLIVYILGTIVLSGLLIATITNTLRSWVDRFKQGTVHYYTFCQHTVFLGYNDMVPGMIETLCGSRLYPKRVRIVVGVTKDVHEVATQLSNHLSKRQRKCVVVLQADCCNPRDLRRLRVRAAKDVYIIGAQDDAYSLNSYNKIQSLCKRHHPECYVQMQYQSTYALFQTYTKKDGMEHFHAFNFHNEWARKMLMREEIDTRNGVGITVDSERQVHLVIIGMTEMGEALAREAAFLCHYPNFVTKGIRTRITFIDPKAEEPETYFKGRYHHLFEADFLDVEFEFLKKNIAEPAMQKELGKWAMDDKQVLTIAACTDMPHRSMAAGLYLPDAIFDRKIPVWIYQPTKGDMAEYLGSSHFDNVTTFGMSGKELDIKNEEGVRQAKWLNHFYWHLNDESIDYSDTKAIDKEWDYCSVFHKWSNVYNVSAIPAKLRSVGGNIEDNVEILAEVEHNRWNVEKLLMGFRPTTDEEHQTILADPKKKKEYKNKFVHDDIRPFSELDEKTKEIDRRFTREIPNIIGA